MSLRDRQREVVRRAILESALELFSQRGFDETTVEMVGGHAGVAGRTVYRYFESKEAILFDQISSEIEAITEAVRQHCSEGVSMRRLVDALATWLGHQAQDPLFARLATLMRDNDALMNRADMLRRELVRQIATQIASIEGETEPRLIDHARAAAVIWVSTAAIDAWAENGCEGDLGALAAEAGSILVSETEG